MSRHRKSNHRPPPPKGRPFPPHRGEPRGGRTHPKGDRLGPPRNCRVVAGIHSCYESLNCRSKDIVEAWFKADPKGDLLTLSERTQELGIKTINPPPRHMNELCASHQGVILFVSSSPELDWSTLSGLETAQLLAVDGVVDPRNLGAIMRTAWLMGVPGILISSSRTSPLSGTVMKVACGAGEHVAIEVCESLGESLKDLKERGFWVYGLEGEAQEGIWEASLTEKVVWVMGSENKGLRRGIHRICDGTLSVPQVTDLASYNVSVAAALAMGEFRRRTPL